MPLGPQIVTYGNIQSSFVLTATITPVSTTNGVTAEQTFTLPGVQLGDQVTMAANFAYSSLVDWINVRVSAANTIAIAFSNGTAGVLTAPTGVYNFEVNRPMPGLSMTGIQ